MSGDFQGPPRTFQGGRGKRTRVKRQEEGRREEDGGMEEVFFVVVRNMLVTPRSTTWPSVSRGRVHSGRRLASALF
eukprot:2280585-Pyramimonas_sp.AAC.1